MGVAFARACDARARGARALALAASLAAILSAARPAGAQEVTLEPAELKAGVAPQDLTLKVTPAEGVPLRSLRIDLEGFDEELDVAASAATPVASRTATGFRLESAFAPPSATAVAVLLVLRHPRTPWIRRESAIVVAVNDATPAAFKVHREGYLRDDKVFTFSSLAVFSLIFFGFIAYAQRGKALFIRRIAGLDAMEEAIGRATEMGKPVLYVPGIENIREIQTIASMVILGHVARMVADYDSDLIVPCRDPVVMSVAEETVQQAYIAAGKLDNYNPDRIEYLSDDQFAYVASVGGTMLREKPAANIYLGAFYAESLILAETGFASGAIQVAGTANQHQLPFFIVACDYTIIGEEFFAASAYLSKEPKVLASIKANDLFKLLLLLYVAAGVAALTLGGPGIAGWLLRTMAEYH